MPFVDAEVAVQLQLVQEVETRGHGDVSREIGRPGKGRLLRMREELEKILDPAALYGEVEDRSLVALRRTRDPALRCDRTAPQPAVYALQYHLAVRVIDGQLNLPIHRQVSIALFPSSPPPF